MNTPLEVELTNKILSAFLDRNGFDSIWDELDYDIKFDIKDEIVEIIRIGIEKYTEELRLLNIGD